MDCKDSFRIVFESIVYDHRSSVSNGDFERVVGVAYLNKVLLHFLRVAGIGGKLRLVEEARYRRFLKNLCTVSDALRGLDHVFIKLRKPVAYVPSDIDVLVAREHVPKAISRLKNRGFEVEIVEPYCVTMIRKDAIVDLYMYPTLGGMIYLDADKLLEHRELGVFNGVEIPVLETYAEALMAIVHAVYKERIYTLNDYITVKRWFSKKSIRLAEELRSLNAVVFALQIHNAVENNITLLPYRIPFPLWIKTLCSKIFHDNDARATSLNIIKTLNDKRIGRHLVSKFTRKTY